MSPAEAAPFLCGYCTAAQLPYCYQGEDVCHHKQLISELDALRARCGAGEALLREVRIIVPEQYETRDRIDAHLKGAGRE